MQNRINTSTSDILLAVSILFEDWLPITTSFHCPLTEDSGFISDWLVDVHFSRFWSWVNWDRSFTRRLQLHETPQKNRSHSNCVCLINSLSEDVWSHYCSLISTHKRKTSDISTIYYIQSNFLLKILAINLLLLDRIADLFLTIQVYTIRSLL